MKAISGKEMCRILKRHGWKHVRTHGSHRRFEMAGRDPITVPVHGNRTLKAGLQRAIMKAAGLTADDL
jgi:predicted RNA binding protein YcfA (HicA-like mRNA interferase family)